MNGIRQERSSTCSDCSVSKKQGRKEEGEIRKLEDEGVKFEALTLSFSQ
jgi:hypothetical protein